MALFKILRGLSENFGGENSTKTTKDGYAYFTPDDGKFYIDISDGQTPIVGSSAKNGANRICINDGGFMDNLVLDCGTANGWSQITITYIDFGDSNILEDDENTIFYDGGDSNLTDEISAVFYDCGTSYYNI